MSKRSILVMGGTGFIGRHLVLRMLDMGEEIVLLMRPSSIIPETLAGRITCVACPDWTLDGLRAVLRNHDFSLICHLASYGVAPDNREIMPMAEINTLLPAALAVLAADRNAGMVVTGSSSEYMRPSGETPLTETASLETAKLYGSSKAAGGLLTSAVAHRLGVDLRILRLFNVYGPGEAPHRLLPSLLRGLRRGERARLSAGSQVRDFIYVEDVIEAIVQAGESTRHDGRRSSVAIWNICTGTGSTVRNFAEMVATQLDVSPGLLGFGDIPMRDDDVPWLVGSPDRIQTELGWQAEYSLERGLQDALSRMSE